IGERALQACKAVVRQRRQQSYAAQRLQACTQVWSGALGEHARRLLLRLAARFRQEIGEALGCALDERKENVCAGFRLADAGRSSALPDLECARLYLAHRREFVLREDERDGPRHELAFLAPPKQGRSHIERAAFLIKACGLLDG